MGGIYFVVSATDEPEAIYFSDEDAFASGFEYIDVFDEEGLKIISYKLNSDASHTCEDDYTTDF